MVNNTRLEGGGVAVVRESRLHQDRTLSTINIIGSKGTGELTLDKQMEGNLLINLTKNNIFLVYILHKMSHFSRE